MMKELFASKQRRVMLRRVLCMLLTLAMVFSMLPLQQMAVIRAEGQEQQNEELQSKDMDAGNLDGGTDQMSAPEGDKSSASTPEAEDETKQENCISGVIWLDVQVNGVKDEDEVGVSDYTVKLYKGDEAIAETKTGENGDYTFTEVEPGDYRVGIQSETIDEVEYLLPIKALQAGLDNHFDTDTNSDPVVAYSEVLTLGADTQAADINGALREPMQIRPLASSNIYRVTKDSDGSQVGVDCISLFWAVDQVPLNEPCTITLMANDPEVWEQSNTWVKITAGKTIKLTSTGGNKSITQRATGGNGACRHIYVDGGNLTLEGIRISGLGLKSGTLYNGGISVGNGGSLTIGKNAIIENCYDFRGGGVNNEGTNSTTTLDGGTVRNNAASEAGGINVGAAGSQLIINSGSVTGNVAINGGGGLGIFSGSQDSSSITINGGEISNNKAYAGAGVNAQGNPVYMTGGNIKNNAASEAGGGIALGLNYSAFTMTGGSITGNSAQYGGGIYRADGMAYNKGIVSISGASSLTNNRAEMTGGAIHHFGWDSYQYSNLSIESSVVFSGNTARGWGVSISIPANIKSRFASVEFPSGYTTNPINNYDIAFPNFVVDVKYQTRSGSAVPGKTNFAYGFTSLVKDSPYKPTEEQLKATNYTLVGWQVDGGPITYNKNPSISLNDQNYELKLIYGQDRGGGGSDDDPKPNDIEDITITKKWKNTSNQNLNPVVADKTVYRDVGTSFTDAGGDIAGYEYAGYKINGAGSLKTGNPDIAINAGDANFSIVYQYKLKVYPLKIRYINRDNTGIETTTDKVTHGYNYTATAKTYTNKVYVGWYIGTEKPEDATINPTTQTPHITNATSADEDKTITLVYGQDEDGPDNIEDFKITRKYQLENGNSVGIGNKADNLNVDKFFTKKYNDDVTPDELAGLTYKGYKLDGESSLQTGDPNFKIEVAKGNREVIYVFSATTYKLTVNFVDRASSAVQGQKTYSNEVTHGQAYTLSPNAKFDIADIVAVGWYKGPIQQPNPTLTPMSTALSGADIQGDTVITIVYGKDKDGPDGIEDFEITRKYQLENGNSVGIADKADNLNVDKFFTKKYNDDVTSAELTGLTYKGYKLDGESSIQTGDPNFKIEVAKGDREVVYVFEKTTYGATVRYVDRNGDPVEASDTATLTHGEAYTAVPKPVTDKVYIGWYIGTDKPEDVSIKPITQTPHIASASSTDKDKTITLVYGKDKVGPDGTEDFEITRKYQLENGTSVGIADKADNLNVDKFFTKKYNDDVTPGELTGLTYEGYRLDGASSVQAGDPNFKIEVAKGDREVIYVFSTTTYKAKVRHVDRFGNVLDTEEVTLIDGNSFTATAKTYAQKLYVGWYIGDTLPVNNSLKAPANTPHIPTVNASYSNKTITLVYGQNKKGPDNIEDFNVTRKWAKRADKQPIDTTNLADKIEVYNVDEFVTKSHLADVNPTHLDGWTYKGYTVTPKGHPEGALITGNPNEKVTVARNDFTITYYYDVTTYDVKVNFVNRSAGKEKAQLVDKNVAHGTHYKAPSGYNTLGFIQGKAYIGWYVGGPNAGATIQTTTPEINPVNTDSTKEITLVYGRDSKGPNNKEDFDVVRRWQMYDGSPIAGMTPATATEIYDFDEVFTKTHAQNRPANLPQGLTYAGFRYDSDASNVRRPASEAVSIDMDKPAGDKGVTYYYTNMVHDLDVTYRYDDNDGNKTALPGKQTGQVQYGQNVDTVGTTPKINVPDATTHADFDQKTVVGWAKQNAPNQVTPGLPSFTDVKDEIKIILVYGQDLDRNGIKDYLVKEYHKEGNTDLTAPVEHVVNGPGSGDSLTLQKDNALVAAGFDYQSYVKDSDAANTGDTLTITEPTQNHKVTFNYEKTGYILKVKYEFQPNDGSARTSVNGFTSYSVSHGDNKLGISVPRYSDDNTANIAFKDMTPTSWERSVGGSGNAINSQSSSPITIDVMNITADTEVTIVYEQDKNNNNTKDYTIKENRVTHLSKQDITGAKPPYQLVYVDEGDTYTGVPGSPTSYHQYEGYIWDQDTADETNPVDPVTKAGITADHEIWFLFSPDAYTVTINYEYHKNDGTVEVLDSITEQNITHGNAFDTGSTPALNWKNNGHYNDFNGLKYEGWKYQGPTDVDPVVGSGDPGLKNVIGATTITLIYVQDDDEDGRHDYWITEEHTTPGNYANETRKVLVNEGDTYDGTPHDKIINGGYVYADYEIQKLSVSGFAPALPQISSVKADETVIFNYEKVIPPAPIIKDVYTEDTIVKGSGDAPGNTITVTWPDGTQDTTIVQPDGSWEVPVPSTVDLQKDDPITAKETNIFGTDSSDTKILVKQTTHKVNVSFVDLAGNAIEKGSRDYSENVAHGSDWIGVAGLINEYEFRYWTLDGVKQSGDVPTIVAIVQDAKVQLFYEKVERKDNGNYNFKKAADVKKVAPGDIINYTISDFGNGWGKAIDHYAISDRPGLGLDFQNAETPAFKNGQGVTYDVICYTKNHGKQIVAAGLDAAKAQKVSAPQLAAGDYIIAISLEFSTVPDGFGQGDTLRMAFRVWDNPPADTLTNVAVLSYEVDGVYKEFSTSGDDATSSLIRPDRFGTARKVQTGDNTNVVVLLSVFIGAAMLLLLMSRLRKREE